MVERLNAWSVRHWKLIVVLFWLVYAAYALFNKWGQIRGFALGDTDDNLRMAQVRALLGGQDWYDLSQHRLDPAHGGANIHWSRLVDLPLAGLMLALRPLIGGADAERWAAAIAPLLALGPMLFALALTTRRLVDVRAVPLVLATMIFAVSTTGMVQPLRIDHHGWQLAFLALALAGLADPERRRGGIQTGLASAASLAIGLEMLIYIALMGAAHVLFWVADRDQRARLAAYAVSFSGGTTAAFLLFASYANRTALCDALTPVWLGDALVGGALMAGLAMLRVERWTVRLALASGAGMAVIAFHALASPQCLTRLEGVSPETTRLWLSHVREARPIYRHGAETIALMLSLPVAGLLGYALVAWRARGNPDLLRRVAAVALPPLTALVLLFWQTRTGPAAQMMAVPGAVAVAFILAPLAYRSNSPLLRVPGTVLAVVVGLGALAPLVLGQIPNKPKSAAQKKVDLANRTCPSLRALAPVARQPRGIVFTFVDLGPRIISVTRHDAIAGPYHRNDQAIADVMNAFRGDAAQARRIIASEYRSHYLLVCPNMSTATIFQSEAPQGFYMQLIKGRVPPWLTPIDLGPKSPYLMWRVAR
ncbi:MAG: AcrB/AcrD/AcrF family protein [Pseudomonadota bacterium]|nr:AcrB/AcrD/AcrF family protein [Pseudomonadota bacterium]